MFSNILQSVLSNFGQVINSITAGDATSKSLVTVWAVTVLGLICRKVPGHLNEWFRRTCVVSIRLETDMSYYEELLYNHALGKVRTDCNSQHFFLRIKRDENSFQTFMQQDYGFSWFFHGFRLYWFERTKNMQKQWGREESCVFFTFGRSAKAFDFLHKDFHVANTPSFRKPDNDEWKHLTHITGASKLFLNPEEKASIDKKVDFFINNRQWYLERNLAWKLVILLHGEPGTGKTSIANYVAQRLGYSVGIMDLATMSKSTFMPLLIAAGIENTVILIDELDISRVGATRGLPDKSKKSEDNGKDDASKTGDTTIDLGSLMSGITLYDLLTAFQGAVPLNGNVVVCTTNDIDSIDSALFRSGRVDLVLEVERLAYPQIKEFFEHNYPGHQWPEDLLVNAEIKGSDLHSTFMDYPFEPEKFIEQLITEHQPTELKGFLHDTFANLRQRGVTAT